MEIKQRRLIFYLLAKIMSVFLVIILNVFLLKSNNSKSYIPLVAIIGGADGPTKIYVAANGWQSILKYSLSIAIIISMSVLIVFDIIGLAKKREYSVKYKTKITLVMVVFIIFLILIYIGFRIFR
jgi:Na+-transporting methylmalonyl-CoA/oxaloacetate decarboxylase beta subunit